jgi:hypothetical protein
MFTEIEVRFLVKEHPEQRMGSMRTVAQLIAIGCPPAFAERTVQRELEKRAKVFGTELAALRKQSPEPENDLTAKINAAF